MNRSIAVVVLTAAALAPLAVVAGRASGARPSTFTVPTNEEQVKRGAYLVTIGGCNDCHTPWKMGEHGPEPDMSRMLSGHPQDVVVDRAAQPPTGGPWMGSMAATMTAWSGPWGVSFTANLTPDSTGLGPWTEEIFINTLRTGKHWGQSRQILPPMPWFNYGKMSDEDLKAVYAYLRTIPPVHNLVPQPIPPGGQVAKTIWD